MPDLVWDEVRSFFDPDLMGQLPDLWIDDTSVDDWQALFDLVRSSGWVWEYQEGQSELPLPAASEVFPRSAESEVAELRVWPVPDVLMIVRMLVPESIDFDIDLRELHGQQRLDVLYDFLSVVGRCLGKSVLMGAEGDSVAVLGFDVTTDRVVLLAEPPLA